MKSRSAGKNAATETTNMRIIWNKKDSRFEAQFGQEYWASDKDSVSRSGMKCTGPPDWIWWTFKLDPLYFLQQNRPVSGLTITMEALERQNILKTELDAAVKADQEYRDVKKAVLKERKFLKETEAPTDEETEHGEFDSIRVMTEEANKWTKFMPPPASSTVCIGCNQPVYFYEKQDPPTCLDCEIFSKCRDEITLRNDDKAQ